MKGEKYLMNLLFFFFSSLKGPYKGREMELASSWTPFFLILFQNAYLSRKQRDL